MKVDVRKERESGIEFLKIIAMMMIVIAHTAQTFGGEHSNILAFLHISSICQDFFINSNVATSNTQYLLIALFRHFGALGNDIFFICSAWFLIDSHRFVGKKIIKMILDVWVISTLLLAICYLFNFPISGKQMIKCFFPTTLASNWYITLYIIIYAIHPFLNMIINHLSAKKMLGMVLWGSFLYLIMGTVKHNLFFSSELITYVVIYFNVAYVKKYLPVTSSNVKLNVIIGGCSLVIGICLILVINNLGLHFSLFNNKLLHFDKNQNFLIVMSAFSLFNLFRHKVFIAQSINKIANLTFFIYIIHENLLVREIFRPIAFVWIKNYLGYGHIVIWILLFALFLFIMATIFSIGYKAFVGKVTEWISHRLYTFIMEYYGKIFSWVSRLK